MIDRSKFTLVKPLLISGLVSLFLSATVALAQESTVAQTAEAAKPPASEKPVGPQPPDGVWLEDDEGQYFLEKFPRVEGAYKWVDEEKGIVKLKHFMPMKVMKYDDEFFYLRMSRSYERKPAKFYQSETNSVGTADAVELSTVDRYQMENFGRGLPGSGQWRNGFELADMNGDGFLDLVHCPPRKLGTGPVIFLGDGAGNWQEWQGARWPAGVDYDYGDVEVADFNGDGELDVALAVHLRGLQLFYGDGKGNFELAGKGLPDTAYAGRTGQTFSSRSLESVDWNGDGKLDIVAFSEGPASPGQGGAGVDPLPGLKVFLNQGDTWVAAKLPQDDVYGDHVEVGDFNNDGKPDLIHDARKSRYTSILKLGNDQGGFDSVELEMPGVAFILAVEAGDVNRDGNLDLAIAYRSTKGTVNKTQGRVIDLYLGDGTGRGFRRVPVVRLDDSRDFQELGFGDLNGDGDLDLVALRNNGETWILLGKGDGTFDLEQSPELEPHPDRDYCRGHKAVMADADGDGRDELFTSFAGEPGSEVVYGVTPKCAPKGSLKGWKMVDKKG